MEIIYAQRTDPAKLIDELDALGFDTTKIVAITTTPPILIPGPSHAPVHAENTIIEVAHELTDAEERLIDVAMQRRFGILADGPALRSFPDSRYPFTQEQIDAIRELILDFGPLAPWFNDVEVLGKDLTIRGTTAVLTEEILSSVTIPADTLDEDEIGLSFVAFGTCAANANVKTIKPYFGAREVVSNDITTAPNGTSWRMEGEIYRKSGSEGHGGIQDVSGKAIVGGVVQSVKTSFATEDDTADIVLKLTGRNGVAQANEIVSHGLIVKRIP